MRKLKYLLFFPILSFLFIVNSYGQCEPDTIGCIDTDNPGQICPDTLPEGQVGVYYEETITLLPPPEAVLSGGITVTIVKIIIDSIGNLPPGIEYTANAVEFYPDTAYCILLNGTPESPGTYDLYIRVIPFVWFMDNVIIGPAQVNDTSLFITINGPDALPEVNNSSFSIIESFPNPFSGKSVIGSYHAKPETVELRIYNLLGKIAYSERMYATTGNNFFVFNGENIPAGTYIYTISNGKEILTRKFIKLE